ncbi:acyl-CoA dehydrogenase family protein [Aeromicrobium yanjiei]|uniref:Acyl-CoA dehydrogenase n=1 Tax=Aeromicrobium yanjiei TaxID=2662028 RepID=A0A5Q2MFW3_9ACTN|nr:acyl-CoA dehydrogenase family protein [Aeromicrobium yanjiei]QGG41528.1 acyl-CoA dehydrogenase [Aeromicrobium yanjiei]
MSDEIKALAASVGAVCGQPAATHWDALEGLGVTLLPVPEDRGGAGSDVATTGAVLRTLGRHSASVPLVETALLGGWMLSANGHDVPAGPLSAAVAGSDVELVRQQDGWTMSGRLPRVPWAGDASRIIVLAAAADGDHLVALDPASAHLEPGHNIAGESRDDVVLDDVALNDAQVLPVTEASGVTREAFRQRGALGRALLMSGAAERVLELTVEQISQRVQFGRSLGAFQAVQQQVAQQAGEVAATRVATEAAALALDADGRAGLAIAAAKVQAGVAAGAVARVGHQLHGAIGFTDEHELHRCTTRLWAWRDEYGNEDEWAGRLGRLTLAGAGDDLWPMLTRTS